ncbi:hypothetical protein GW17_00038762 [Ensete ventricosum]|nr:hypothetical protein GW17_00038762 [Ensete ventricosum]
MKVKAAARYFSNRTIFYTVLALAFLLPFVFILTAVDTLEGVNDCSSLGRFRKPLLVGLEFVAFRYLGLIENMDKEVKRSRLAEQLHKHFVATAIPKGIYCLALRLTDEYSYNARARKQLPAPELLSLLSDNSCYHFVLATDNILAASVVVTSVVRSSLNPGRVVFHVITDKKTYPGMHSWFALNPLSPAIIEVKGVHQFYWLRKEKVPVLEAIANYHGVRNHYHGNHIVGTNVSENPRVFTSKLLARSPKYISLLNHMRIYLPEVN